MAKRIAIKDLRAGSINATPINVDDWREVFAGHDGYTQDENTFWESVTCEECGKVIVYQNGGGGARHSEECTKTKCEGYLSMAEGPMMNYWYPVDSWQIDSGSGMGGPESSAKAVADLPVCIVQVNGQYGLALTGGGMDLSWEICEAYTRLGLLPPVHFCKLPRMAGRGTSAKDRYIIAACRAAVNVQIKWAKSTLRDLRGMGK